MTLKDLSGAQAMILRALYDRGSCVRGILVKELEDRIPNGTISSCLNRLEAMGLVERLETAGGEWMINLKGATLFAQDPSEAPSESAAVQAMLAVARNPELDALTPEPEALPPEAESEKESPPAALHDFLLEEAVWEVKTRLAGDWEIPPLTRRVYAEVLECLPAPLQAALQPLTEYLGTMK